MSEFNIGTPVGLPETPSGKIMCGKVIGIDGDKRLVEWGSCRGWWTIDQLSQLPAQAENRLAATRARVAAAEAALDTADATTIDNARVLYNAALHEMWQAMKAEEK